MKIPTYRVIYYCFKFYGKAIKASFFFGLFFFLNFIRQAQKFPQLSASVAIGKKWSEQYSFSKRMGILNLCMYTISVNVSRNFNASSRCIIDRLSDEYVTSLINVINECAHFIYHSEIQAVSMVMGQGLLANSFDQNY